MNDPAALVGAAVPRREDRRFLTGDGRFTDDLRADGALVGVVLRSPHAHARLDAVDAARARAMPGVRLVLTGDDLAGRVGPIPSLTRTPPFAIESRDGSPMPQPDQPVLATGKVRYAGEPVAFVVASTRAQAQAAADAVDVRYQPLPARVTPDGPPPGAAPVWDECPHDVSFEWEGGDAAATDAAFAAAAHVARVTLVNNRVAPVFLEPRAALGEVDPESGRLTLRAGSQTAHRMRDTLAGMLGIAPAELRVVTPDTGGGFGARGAVYPEMALVLIAARAVGRSVRWTATRGESFLSDTQSRDHLLHGELAMDADGRFTALRVRIDWRHGAYVPGRGIWVIVRFLVPTLGGVYAIPAGHTVIRGRFSNTTPLAAYRGVGRVEATYLIESLVDAAARDLGLDRVALRRLNVVREERLPWTAPGGARYEACTFAPHLEQALAMADWDGFAARRSRSAAAGRLRGIGCALYVENDGGAPSEYARVQVAPDGAVTVALGTQNFGMGHETVFAQVVAERLGVPFERVRAVDGDTDAVARGSGSHGSRSMRAGGTAAVMGVAKVIERGRALAARMLEASPADVEYAAGAFRIAGTDREVTLAQAAAFAERHGERLEAEADFEQRRESYSSGCHVCEVEVDPETGRTTLLAHVIVTDVGRAVNPMLVDGQVHGGAAQGVGQAAMEGVVYDPDSGQPVTGSLMDYALPRAADLPFFTTATAETPETDNPLGVKGVGEGPTTGSPAAYMNALRDALAAARAGPVQMPATPYAVWQALRGANATPRAGS